jgi:hypothetical protein
VKKIVPVSPRAVKYGDANSRAIGAAVCISNRLIDSTTSIELGHKVHQ